MNPEYQSKGHNLSHFKKNDLEGLSSEQKYFAEEQFRVLYAEQMSKLSMELCHKKKVLDNIHTLDEQQQKSIQDQYQKLKTKMAEIEQKRTKRLEEKVKHYKQNDERWYHKLKDIQSKFRQQNRQAVEKARKYREESENYWKSKEKKVKNSRTEFIASKKKDQETLNYTSLQNNEYNKERSKTNNKAYSIQSKSFFRQSQVKPPTQDLDQQIRLHKQRSENIQKQKQSLMFQKALTKLEKINKKRQRVNKEHEPKVAEPTKPKRVDRSYHSNKNRRQDKKSPINTKIHDQTLNRSKESLQNLIQSHLAAKNKIEEQQFLQRGEIMENNLQKNRKDKILKMVRNRIQQMKVETLKNENSAVRL